MSSTMNCERRTLDKLLDFGFPPKFKQIGIISFILFFIGLFVNAFFFEDHILRYVFKYGLLVSLVIISLSKEEVDDEMLQSLKLKSYTLAFLIAIMHTLLLPFINYLVDLMIGKEPVLQESGDWMILWLLLFIQVFYYELLKRTQ